MERVNTGVRLLDATVDKLDAAAERMGGKSRAFVIEVLAALYADQLSADTQIPVGLIPGDSRAKKTPRDNVPPAEPKKRGRPKKDRPDRSS